MSAISACVKESASERLFSDKYNPDQKVLEDCTLRIQQIIKKTSLGIPSENENLEAFTCNISLVEAKDPVVTKCKHLFDRAQILRWLKINPTCPFCHDPVAETELGPLPMPMENLLAEWKKEEPIPSFLHFEKENKGRALVYLGLAKDYAKEKNYKKSLEAYKEAFQYTKASEDYASLPLLYEESDDLVKASLAYLHLGSYQLEEGLLQEVITTLKRYKQIAPNSFKIDGLIIGLELLLDPSSENLKRAMEVARSQDDLKEAIFIYRQVIAYNPYQFDAYGGLAPLLNFEERKDLFLEAFSSAIEVGNNDLAVEFAAEAEACVFPASISEADWASSVEFIKKLQPYPQELQDFLNADCPVFGSRKKVWETHIVVPLFKNITRIIDGVPVQAPRTLQALHELGQATKGVGYSFVSDEILASDVDIPSEVDFEWAVMTKDVFPDSRNIDFDSQKQLVESKGYEMPSFLDVATCVLLEKRGSEEILFGDDQKTCAVSHNQVQGCHVIVGFSPGGLYVNTAPRHGCGNEKIGAVGVRKFRGC